MTNDEWGMPKIARGRRPLRPMTRTWNLASRAFVAPFVIRHSSFIMEPSRWTFVNDFNIYNTMHDIMPYCLRGFLSCFLLASVTLGAAPALDLRKGDHICLIGNALPDRMQHDGWLETLIVAQHPQHDLVFPKSRRGGR